MDARNPQSLQATRYALQYAIKQQTVLDNVAIVEMAFKRRVSREAALQTTDYARGIGRLLSLAYSSSGVMEIGGPLATVILHEGEAVTFGCAFERLILIEGLNILNNFAVKATVVSRNGKMKTQTSIAKYTERPPCLEGLCCHGYRYAEYPRVPEIVGPRLPDATKLGSGDYEEQTELYYRMSALLYQPFRDPTAFLSPEGSARDHYERWSPLSNGKIARALERHQQHYICLLHAQEYRASQRSAEDDTDGDSVCADDDVLPTSAFRQPDNPRFTAQYEAVPAEFYSVDIDPEMASDVQPQSHAAGSSLLAKLLIEAITSAPLQQDVGFDFTAIADIITRQQVRRFQTIDRDDSLARPTTVVESTEIMVECYDRAVRNLSFDRARLPRASLERYASVQDISAHFRLNYLQQVAFTLISVPLLQRLAGGFASAAAHSIFDDTPIIITGAGGTGKSQIIAAVRALAAAWMQPLAIAAVASTGIAASSLQGMTMHSSVGLGINAKVLPKHITSPKDALLRQWASVQCVIADEVSTVDLGFFDYGKNHYSTPTTIAVSIMAVCLWS